MRLQPSSYNRTDPLFPYTTLFRSGADGGRDQPRQPAHPVGAAPGDAGAPRLGGRGVPSAAAALPRVGDAEPAGAGGHVTTARGAARSLPPADRRGLYGRDGGAAHDAGVHRRRGSEKVRTSDEQGKRVVEGIDRGGSE